MGFTYLYFAMIKPLNNLKCKIDADILLFCYVSLSKIMLSDCHVLDESLRNEIDSVY